MLAVAFASLLEQALVVGVQLFSHDGVRVLEDGELLWRYLADDADGETGAGERLTVDHLGGKAQADAELADLVLEEVIKRLDEVEVHALREGNQVVVALDRGGLAAGLAGAGLDDVWVDGALGQVLDPVELLGDGEELLPELRADAAALLLRVRHAGQQPGVALLRVHVDQGHVELLAEDLLHHLGLALAEHAVVHEHAGELVADGAVHERGHDGGVDAAGEREDHLAVTHLLADRRDLLVDDVVHGPVALEAADAKQEVLQD